LPQAMAQPLAVVFQISHQQQCTIMSGE